MVNITWPFISQADVIATVEGSPVDLTWTGASQVTFAAAVASGDAWVVYRETSIQDAVVDFTDGSVLTESDLDTAHKQLRFSLQEAIQRGLGGDAQLRTDLLDSAAGASLVSFDDAVDYNAGSLGAAIQPLFGALISSPNYVGTEADSAYIITDGTSAAPSLTQGAALVVQKTSSNAAGFNALAAFATKKSTAANARATAFFAEAVDNVGGDNSYVEAIRPQATLTGGTLGSAYGAVSVAGATSDAVTPKFLIGHESVVDNHVLTDALDPSSFNKDSYRASFVATNGSGTGSRAKSDVAFYANYYNSSPFRTGLMFAQNSIDHTGIKFNSGLTIVNGIEMSGATISGYAFKSPNFSIDGTGGVSFGTLTANADAAITGYITIKDAGGTTRKLAVIA